MHVFSEFTFLTFLKSAREFLLNGPKTEAGKEENPKSAIGGLLAFRIGIIT